MAPRNAAKAGARRESVVAREQALPELRFRAIHEVSAVDAEVVTRVRGAVPAAVLAQREQVDLAVGELLNSVHDSVIDGR
jgi:hypothetical protein